MKTGHPILAAALAALLLPLPASAADEEARPWWLDTQRLVQTNLREIDATMDVDQYVREVKAFGANVVLFNVGGIVANYPTELDYHWRNRHMEGDLVGTVLPRLHAEGIRMIGRFDFSKINEKFAAEHPEWLYVSERGKNVNYNGQVHTCVSGGYQQEYLFKILGEAVDRYPLDGVFFNMIGFTTGDYSRNYHGLCQCRNCAERFKDYSGMDLPAKVDPGDPAYRKYQEWTREMKDRQFTRVRDFLKHKRPDLAICTYTLEGVDVIRKESNLPLSEGTYHDTDKAKWTLLTSDGRQLANAAVHFIDIPWRHSAVSPQLTGRRLWQCMINGAWLDFYCIGPLQRQEDRTGLDVASGIYRFHAANERWLMSTIGAGQVGLVRRGEQEYLGLLEILSENQVAYELAQLQADQLNKFPLVIVPDAGELNEAQSGVLDRYVAAGGKLLLTGQAPANLKCLGETALKEVRPQELGSYVRIGADDRDRLGRPGLDALDLVFLSGPFAVYETGADVTGMLRLIPQDMFGPPEKCYYRQVSEHPGLLFRRHGKGAVACFTFGLGTHYAEQAHVGHSELLMGAIDNVLGLDRRLKVTAPPVVEASHRTDPHGRFEWIGLFNHSGQRDKAMHRPLPIRDIQVSLEPRGAIKSVRLLQAGCDLEAKPGADARVLFTVPELEHYEVVLVEYGGVSRGPR
ncbi:MAG: hypothetical protein ACOY3P_10285 [Planctomycetota bacterium]